MITTIDKALVALIGATLSIAAAFGVNVEWASPELVGAVGAVITGFLTWLVPNKDSDGF